MTRLLAALMMIIAAPLSAQEFSDQEKAAIDAQVRAYILANPEIIVEAMTVLEQRNQDAQAEADRELLASMGDALYDDGFSHVAGNPDGDVTVVEFLDYRCPYCKRAHETVKALLASDPNVRFVVKEFPILGPDSTFASRAAMAALEQGGEMYEKYNDAMMLFQGELNQQTVMQIAAQVGLDVERLSRDVQDPEIAANIRETYALARRLDISGTPAFIVGGTIVRGFLPFDSLRELVEDQRRRG